MSQGERSAEPDSVAEHVRSLVAAGYDDRQTVIDRVNDYVTDESNDEALIARVPELVDRAIAAQLAAQKSWPQTTECDLLDAAFTKLERSGIVARQNFTCCQTCGFAEIGDELDQVKASGIYVRGLTFFHQQDTESAVEGGGVYLSYAATEDGHDGAEIAREIVAVLTAHGLKPNWDGTTAQRIEVPLNWQRRFPGKEPTVARVAATPAKRDLWALFGLRRPKQ
jgi:hypothetical protein